MALQVPSAPNPFDPTTPLANAYAWISSVSLDLSRLDGRLTLNINPNAANRPSVPISQVNIALGQTLTPASEDGLTPATKFPALADFMTDPAFAAAYEVLATKFYTACLNHPTFAGSSIV